MAGDLVELVECIDEFSNKTMGKKRKRYSITYRSMDFLIKKEVDAMHDNLQDLSADLNSSKAK